VIRRTAMTLLPRSVVLSIALICIGAMLSRAESSRMVNVADGVSLRVIEAGKVGNGPVLVFIPGWSIGDNKSNALLQLIV